jgi:hypothetical protein
VNELRRKVSALVDSIPERDLLVDLIIDVVARGLGRLGGRPRNGACVCDENSKSGVSEPVSEPKKEHGSDLILDLRLSPDLGPDPSKPLIRERESDEPPDFVTFWAHYPRKDAKADARRAWKRRRPDLAKCLAALDWQRKRPEWLTPAADGRCTIPLPASWINGERWNDERPTVRRDPNALPVIG